MVYEYFNNNPADKIVGDCVVRAISLATDESWDKTYIALALQGFLSKDIMNSNAVWGAYLMQNGFERYTLPHTCPECYSFSDFAEDHPKGIYVFMDKVVDIIKDIETICAMREASEDGGYSNYTPMYMYDDGMSYARGRGRYAKRDSMGRYSTEDGYSNANEYSGNYSNRRGYSRDDSRDHMVSELERMEREATDENQRNMIRNWKNQLKTA